VALSLQFALGGSASLFAVVDAERIFKLLVSLKAVGLAVYQLGSFANVSFKVFFHLWNSHGYERAHDSSLTQG
jgi:hypothetical protein